MRRSFTQAAACTFEEHVIQCRLPHAHAGYLDAAASECRQQCRQSPVGPFGPESEGCGFRAVVALRSTQVAGCGVTQVTCHLDGDRVAAQLLLESLGRVVGDYASVVDDKYAFCHAVCLL